MADIIKIVKICSTPEERIEGLQNTPIEFDECCLFIYEYEKVMPKFWGKNTLYRLYASLVKDGVVVDTQEIQPMSENSVVLYGEGDMVIESRKKLYPGQEVIFHGDTIEVK